MSLAPPTLAASLACQTSPAASWYPEIRESAPPPHPIDPLQTPCTSASRCQTYSPAADIANLSASQKKAPDRHCPSHDSDLAQSAASPPRSPAPDPLPRAPASIPQPSRAPLQTPANRDTPQLPPQFQCDSSTLQFE